MGVYSIHSGSENVGMATVERQGLYYIIECVCQRRRKEPYRIYVRCAEQTTDFGICVPSGSVFAMRTKKSVRQIGEGDLYFFCDAESPQPDASFFPLDADKPFAQLYRLQYATLDNRDGIIGLCFTDQSPAQQGNDQSPAHGNK